MSAPAVSILQRLKTLAIPPNAYPLVLLGLCGLSYGLLIPRFGFYWDDWVFVWIAEKLGDAGLERYFSTNRPYWGLIYRLTTALMNTSVPWHWQVFGLVWRWLSAVALWSLLRRTWQRQPEAAAWASALFVVYPAFSSQAIAVNYGHFFIVLTAFLLSCSLSLRSLQQPGRAWIYTPLALLLAAVNLLAMEYFFLLELLRPLLIWISLAEPEPVNRPRARKALRAWLPYLVLFLAVSIWRAFFFPHQTRNYDLTLVETLRDQPMAALLHLAGTISNDLWLTAVEAWLYAFRLPNPAALGARTTLMYALLVGVAAASMGLALALLRWQDAASSQRKTGWQMAAVGAAGLLIAGWPIWLVNLPLAFGFPNTRFTLPFMLGSCLLFTGVLLLLPGRTWMKTALLALVIGFSVGVQFQSANAYRRDWQLQKNLFWQMAWRVPKLKPGTTLLFNDLPIQFASDNSLTAPFNWIYAPGNRTERMDYMIYVTSIRMGLGLPGLQPGLPIRQDYLAATFEGDSSQVIALHYQPPGCLRVLDADLDPLNKMLPVLSRQAAALSRVDLIQPASSQEAVRPPQHIFGGEPQPDWCYYQAHAEFARQLGDWEAVAALGDQAFKLNDYPNDPAERLVFIEGYARTGNWERARQLTDQTHQITPLMQPALCRLWERIQAAQPGEAQTNSIIQETRSELGCSNAG